MPDEPTNAADECGSDEQAMFFETLFEPDVEEESEIDI